MNITYISISCLLLVLDVKEKINQTFKSYYLEMWLFNKISCEIQILNEKVGKLMIENGELREEIKQLEIDKIHWRDLYWEECEKNKKLEQENKKLEHKNKLQEKALIRLCLKHHYDSIIIEGEEVIDMSNYKVVEKKKPKEEKLF